MPYADPDEQRAYMRQKMRERRAAAKAQAVPVVNAQVRPAQENARPAIIPDVMPETAGPVRPLRADRRQLRGDYWQRRDAGEDDSAAQAGALQRSTVTRQERQRQAQREQYERELADLAPQFVIEARRRLSTLGGYNEADVWPAAYQLAAQTIRQRQRPRLPDAMPKRLAAPVPFRLPPEQQAGFIWMGRLRRVGHALGDGRNAVQEESRNAVRALIASLIRQPMPEPTDVATALAVAPLGVPPRLGTPLSGEAAEEISPD